MKRATITGIFIILAFLISTTSCHSLKSEEEGEVFLQTEGKRPDSFNNQDSLQSYYIRLFTAEKIYDFTPSQLLRLRQTQLKECQIYNTGQASKLIAETDRLALASGNDSLLCAVRWDIFRVYQMQYDTTAALKVLQQQQPLICRLYGEGQLIPYYYAMALIYNYHNRPDQYLYWLQKARPSKAQRLFSWYNMICEAYLKAGHYETAILYADSALAVTSQGKKGNSIAGEVKGEALRQLFRTQEALLWYASAIHNIDSIREALQIEPYSINQKKIIHQYANLLYDTEQFQEAINQLNKIISTDISKKTIIHTEDCRDRSIATVRLMANCYRALSKQELSRQYTRQADSLQFVLNKARMDINHKKTGEELQNLLLKEQIEQQLSDIKKAQHKQYFLFGLVILLLAIITAGLLFWRHRQKRLRHLFDLLTSRHALWLEQHYEPIALLPHEEAAAEIIPSASTADHTQEQYHRLYLRVLYVMQKEKPFLEPDLDLIRLSRHVGTNRTTLSSVLNKETGMSFSNWLAEYRVNYLIEQLAEQTDKSVSELYPLAGFSSRTTFFRQFRQVTGITPSQYMARQVPNHS